MKKVQRKSRSRRYESPLEWPAWTDQIRYAPTDDEERWAADNLNDGPGHDADEPPDSYYDALFEESGATDRLERGLL